MSTSRPFEPVRGTWDATDFRFDSGDVMPTLRFAYTTVDNPDSTPVLILHNSNGSGASFLADAFASELFGPGQPLDAAGHFIVLPDAIGCGRSAKPSDGLRMRFPHYSYDDAVRAQHLLLTQGLGIRHVRVLLSHSIGGMQAWLWAQAAPGVYGRADADGRAARADVGPQLNAAGDADRINFKRPGLDGDYTRLPRHWRHALIFFSLATNGGNRALQRLGATRAPADAVVDQRLAAPFTGDAND